MLCHSPGYRDLWNYFLKLFSSVVRPLPDETCTTLTQPHISVIFKGRLLECERGRSNPTQLLKAFQCLLANCFSFVRSYLTKKNTDKQLACDSSASLSLLKRARDFHQELVENKTEVKEGEYRKCANKFDRSVLGFITCQCLVYCCFNV